MVAAAVVAGSIGGALISSVASGNAADKQADSADRAADLSHDQYMQAREDQAPWRQAGAGALSQLAGGLQAGGEFNRSFTMADYQADPGYQFRLSEGERGINNSAAARGSKYSGATLKALNRFNSDQASQEYGKSYDRFNNDVSTRFNRLASVAGVGQTATNMTTQAGQTYAGQAGQAIQDAGTARASGYVGTANAVNSAAGQIGNYYMLNSMLPKTIGAAGFDPVAAGTSAGAVSNVLY